MARKYRLEYLKKKKRKEREKEIKRRQALEAEAAREAYRSRKVQNEEKGV